MSINCNSIRKYLFQSGQNQWIETTNLYYDIYTEGNVEVTVRVKAMNNRQNISLAESASKTTASFSKITVLLFLLAPYHCLFLHQLIMWFNAKNMRSFHDSLWYLQGLRLSLQTMCWLILLHHVSGWVGDHHFMLTEVSQDIRYGTLNIALLSSIDLMWRSMHICVTEQVLIMLCIKNLRNSYDVIVGHSNV